MDDRLPALLPRPRESRSAPGTFWLTEDSPVEAEAGAGGECAAVRRALRQICWPGSGPAARPALGHESADSAVKDQDPSHASRTGASRGSIAVARVASLAPDGYALFVGPDRIRIEAGGPAGAFYAAVTLRQLLPDAAWRAAAPASHGERAGWPVPCVEIKDAPALPWRGAHLDVARHFCPKRQVLDFIDALAAHKLNVLHLHLTDDQGWRIESPSHPALHEVGSHRPRSRISPYGAEPVYEELPHGGYYRLADLAEIHAHAAQRMITVVPEVDVPGHASAMLAAVPGLGAGPAAQSEVAVDWGVFNQILAPLPSTVDFLGEVFGELLAAMPAPYVHIGGDECVLEHWHDDERVRDYRLSLGLSSDQALHAYFLRQLADLLAGHGARAVVWDEGSVSSQSLPQRLRPDTVVMAWRGGDVARAAAEAGHDVVMTPETLTYFDHDQAAGERPAAAAAVGWISAADVAALAPVPADWPADVARRVLGTQFQLWTEFIRDGRALDFMAFPRACVLAEVAWSGQPADWEDLSPRLAAHVGRLDAMGVEYRPLAGPHPWQSAAARPRAAAVPSERPVTAAEPSSPGRAAHSP